MALADHTKSGALGTPATLQSLLSALGPALLRVLAAPHGAEVPVRGTAIFDPADPIPDGADGILLLVGSRVDTPAAMAVVREAAEHGYVAVVVKARGGPVSDLVEAASTVGLAVLVTPDDMPWRHLDGLLASILGAGRLPAEVTSSGGEALFALANTMSAIIGGSVAIEDLEQHVLAYSSIEGQRIDPLRERGILDRQVPDYPHHRQQYLDVLRRQGVTRFPEFNEELPRAAVAVRAGDLPLGTIWAIESATGLSTEGEQALLEGARMAALHMLRGQDVYERERHLQGEVLRAALAGAHPMEDAGERLGLTPGTEYCLIGYTLVDLEGSAALLPRVGSAIGRYAVAFRPDAITTLTTRAVYLLVPGSASSVRRLAEGAMPAAERAAGAVPRGAISAPSTDPSELQRLRQEVDAILRAAASDNHAPRVATVADVHARLLLDRMSDTLTRDTRLRHPAIERITEYDGRHGSDYGATVLAWLEAQSDMRVAAQRLSVHPNTLRYRLRRIQERFDLDLTDPDSRLSAWLQLRAQQTEAARS